MTDEFVPSPPEPIDPNDALADLEASFEAQGEPADLLVVEEPPPPIGRSWAYDFGTRQFVTKGHGPLATQGISTLTGWIEKCLRTARGAHPIHPPGYGMVNPTELMGVLTEGAPVAELEARIRDALTFHDRIADIEDFDWNLDPDDEWVSISFSVLLDDDSRLPVETSLPVDPTQTVIG